MQPPSDQELQGLLGKAIRLLDGELDLVEAGQRADLIKVLTELRHQIAALVALQKVQRDKTAMERAILDSIRTVDEGLWLQVIERLEALPVTT